MAPEYRQTPGVVQGSGEKPVPTVAKGEPQDCERTEQIPRTDILEHLHSERLSKNVAEVTPALIECVEQLRPRSDGRALAVEGLEHGAKRARRATATCITPVPSVLDDDTAVAVHGKPLGDAQIEVKVFGERLAASEAADRFNCGAPEERARRRNGHHARQYGLVTGIYDGLLRSDFARCTVGVDLVGEAVYEPALWMCLERQEPDLDRLRQESVVAVVEDKELPLGQPDTVITGLAYSTFGLPEHANARDRLRDSGRTVSRAIVDDDDLEWLDVL